MIEPVIRSCNDRTKKAPIKCLMKRSKITIQLRWILYHMVENYVGLNVDREQVINENSRFIICNDIKSGQSKVQI